MATCVQIVLEFGKFTLQVVALILCSEEGWVYAEVDLEIKLQLLADDIVLTEHVGHESVP